MRYLPHYPILCPTTFHFSFPPPSSTWNASPMPTLAFQCPPGASSATSPEKPSWVTLPTGKSEPSLISLSLLSASWCLQLFVSMSSSTHQEQRLSLSCLNPSITLARGPGILLDVSEHLNKMFQRST